MAIRKVLLPLQAAATTEAAFSTAVMVARMWGAHLAVLHVGTDRARNCNMRTLFERLVAEHGLPEAEVKPNADAPTASFTALVGREPEVVAYQARLADMIVVAHPASDKEVSSSDALHAVLFDSAKPVLIAPRSGPLTLGKRICIGWNGTASAVLSAFPWLHRAQSRVVELHNTDLVLEAFADDNRLWLALNIADAPVTRAIPAGAGKLAGHGDVKKKDGSTEIALPPHGWAILG